MRVLALAVFACVVVADAARAQLAVLDSWNPAQAADLCGLGFDPAARHVWVYGCSAADVQRYSTSGVFQNAVPRPGESANDVDVELAPEPLTLAGTTDLPKGALLFVNGETAVAEIYAVDKTSGAVLAALGTAFGGSHVVGGAYHRERDTFFLVQDRVPGAATGNRIAEVDRASGAVLSSFAIGTTFDVNFGDVEVCAGTGNLLVASSFEARLAEYTPAGAFVAYHALPAGVTSLAGIGLDDAAGEVWAAGTGGTVWRLGGGGCPAVPDVPVFPTGSSD
jgi:hypothetical protein